MMSIGKTAWARGRDLFAVEQLMMARRELCWRASSGCVFAAHFDCSPDGLVKRWGEEDLYTAVPVEEF